jgi:uncharacterized protein (DUF58 family)
MRKLTPRFTQYLTVSLTLIAAALLTGRIEILALAAPVTTALAAGLLFAADPVVQMEAEVDLDRCLEGDELIVTLSARARRSVPEAEIAVRVPGGFEDREGLGFQTISLPEEGLRIPLTAVRWGTYPVGDVGIRAYGPGRFVRWEKTVHEAALVKVFPTLERIRRAPAPPETQLFVGNYLARDSGDGIEFAQVRPFLPGDRIRSVNWRVTTRRGELHANLFHPERNADVVIFLDAFGDFGSDRLGSLEIAVRGAAGITDDLLRRKDRVGLVSFGGIVRWIDASMAREQEYRIVDTLLESEALFSYARKDIALLPPRTLPPSATLIAFSPLVDDRSIQALNDLRDRGFPLIVVDTLPEPLIAPQPTPEGDLAHRVWRMQRDELRTDLSLRGIPVLDWWEAGRLDAALAGLPPLPRFGRATS